MHPGLAVTGPLDNGREGIERAGVHLARLHADHGRAGQILGQAVGPHPALIIGRHPADPFPAEPDQPEGLDHGGMGLFPDEDGQLGRPEQPIGLRVPASEGQLVITRSGERGGIGHGRPRHEDRGGARWQAEQLTQPPGHHIVQPRRGRRHDRQGRVLIPRCRQPGRRQRDGVGAAGDEPEVPAAGARHGRRGSRLIEQRQRRGRVPRPLRQRLIETREPGHRSTIRGHRALIQAGEIAPGAPGYLS